MKSVDYFEDILIFIKEEKDRENGNEIILKIIEKICLNRSLKGVEKEIYKYYRNTDERELIEKICKIALKNS